MLWFGDIPPRHFAFNAFDKIVTVPSTSSRSISFQAKHDHKSDQSGRELFLGCVYILNYMYAPLPVPHTIGECDHHG